MPTARSQWELFQTQHHHSFDLCLKWEFLCRSYWRFIHLPPFFNCFVYTWRCLAILSHGKGREKQSSFTFYPPPKWSSPLNCQGVSAEAEGETADVYTGLSGQQSRAGGKEMLAKGNHAHSVAFKTRPRWIQALAPQYQTFSVTSSSGWPLLWVDLLFYFLLDPSHCLSCM